MQTVTGRLSIRGLDRLTFHFLDCVGEAAPGNDVGGFYQGNRPRRPIAAPGCLTVSKYITCNRLQTSAGRASRCLRSTGGMANIGPCIHSVGQQVGMVAFHIRRA